MIQVNKSQLFAIVCWILLLSSPLLSAQTIVNSSADTLISPSPISMHMPVFPDSARKSGLEGSFTLYIIVDTNGTVSDIRILQNGMICDVRNFQGPERILVHHAVAEVRDWQFEPAMLDKTPISVWIDQLFTFICNPAVTSDPEPPFLDEFKTLIRTIPDYPENARIAGIEGRVILRVWIDEEGFVCNAEPVLDWSEDIFIDAALSCIRKWRFKAVLRGRSIPLRISEELCFLLDSNNQPIPFGGLTLPPITIYLNPP